MPAITAPNIETQQVVTGISYTLSISESESGTGITRIEIGPYYFDGPAGRTKFPEAPTSELCPADFESCTWIVDRDGAAWLRFDGGIITAQDGERIFMFTSNFPASMNGTAKLRIWRGSRSETFDVSVPDYTQLPPARNHRRDSTGLGWAYRGNLGV